MRTKRLVLLAVMFAAGACGRGGADVAANSATTSGRGYAARYWYSPKLAGSSRTVTVTFDAPSGVGCEEKHTPVVEHVENYLVLSVRTYEPFVPTTCALAPQSIEADLGAPLGDALLKGQGDDTAYRVVDGRLEIVAESTPCGRVDCSTPSPSPAACSDQAYDMAIREGIDGNIGSANEHCDGSFLILTLNFDSACLPEQARDANCRRSNTAYFVSRSGSWHVVTYAAGETCDAVWHQTHIRFPAALCT